MIDKSKRLVRPTQTLEQAVPLKNRQIYFDSIAEMFKVRAQESPDSIFVYYYDQVITYAQTNERSNRVANFLKSEGVKKGDFISVMVMNSPECYYTMFGAQKLGAVAGAINYMLKGPEIAYVLDDCKPKVAFVSSEFMSEFARGWELAEHKPLVVEVVTGVDHGTQVASFELTDILESYPNDEALVPQSPDDPFMLLYSSGTTGHPKGILLSNRNQLANCQLSAKMKVLEAGDIMMVILPMFHTNPLCVFTYPLAYQGLTVCIRKTFSPDDFWPALMQYGVTVVMAVPAMYAYVYSTIDPDTIDLSKLKLRYAFAGAAPFPVELVQAFQEKFGVTVIDGYGLTEAAGLSTQSFNLPANWRSIGAAVPDQEVEIMDENNNILPYGEKGEICIKSDVVMLGYLNQPEATAEAIKDGWLHTGDMGYMDEQGYVYIAGRKKEMINRGGENIYPREIEIPLEGHPQIAEAVVIGIADPSLGERVKACIILKEPGTLTAEEVKTYLSDKIAKYKIPEFVEFMNDFPRNSTGKVLKLELKKMYEAK
ncbi:MAG: acyl--CoA ligase [Syntrophomonadaceae bacterium]|nr:acyl--CoA ligase [Syntrophomonadaceae bacterium]